MAGEVQCCHQRGRICEAGCFSRSIPESCWVLVHMEGWRSWFQYQGRYQQWQWQRRWTQQPEWRPSSQKSRQLSSSLSFSLGCSQKGTPVRTSIPKSIKAVKISSHKPTYCRQPPIKTFYPKDSRLCQFDNAYHHS